uniref:AIG1-type G domain-containing protein n=1 Tax=Neolamprologus brichardi TaxID=32507 RepID=A0A3Q4G4Q4_NEOBR
CQFEGQELKIFGKEAHHYTMVLFTYGDNLEEDEVNIEDFIKESKALSDFILHSTKNNLIQLLAKVFGPLEPFHILSHYSHKHESILLEVHMKDQHKVVHT